MEQQAKQERTVVHPEAGTRHAGMTGPLQEHLSALSLTLNAAPRVQRLASMNLAVAQRAPNRTGLPDTLKAGVESLSGLSMDHVRVHYNSAKPAQLNAHAYAQGSEIHVAPGQQRHLPHEAWHVVQQAQGRVQPTMQMGTGMSVNDDMSLEHEADVMGSRASAGATAAVENASLGRVGSASTSAMSVAQRRLYIYRDQLVDDALLGQLREKATEQIAEGDTAGPTADELLAAHLDPHTDFRVDIRGSITGRHGYSITGLDEIVRAPGSARSGNLSLDPHEGPVGFRFRGRPGWSPEVIAAIHARPGLENIRHVIPYHLIRASLETYLARIFSELDSPAAIRDRLTRLATEINVGIPHFDADVAAIRGLSMLILARLNSVEGNLWAGSAEENQRLNSLRVRLASIIEALVDGRWNGEQARGALQESSDHATSPVYRQLIDGVLRHLPPPHSSPPGTDDRAVFIARLQLAADSAEIDVFPNEQEMTGLANPEQFLRNIPELMEILTNFRTGNFEDAARVLARIPSPHPPPG